MSIRKKEGKPSKKERKDYVFQVCVTKDVADMLVEVAKEHHNGRVSHAIRALIEKPLQEAYKQLKN